MQAQVIKLPATYAYPLAVANTNAPGFIWNVSQVASGEPNSIAWAQAQLNGLEGVNLADPSAYYTATGPATVPADPNLPITFLIPDVINFSIVGNSGSTDCSHNRPELPCETGMVGTPGTGANPTQNIAAEALTYLALPAGPLTIGVRSDDGFQLQLAAASPNDRYSTNAVVVAKYDGGRGAGNTEATIQVPQAGLYAARLIYEQGGGDANVEFYTLTSTNAGSPAVLVGDVANGGIAAYQSITAAATGSYVANLFPPPGATGIPVLPNITATIVNGTAPVSQIKLVVDGNVLTPTLTTTATGVSLAYQYTNVLANLASHSLRLTWNDNGKQVGIKSTFVGLSYTALAASQVVIPDTTKPGFRFNIYENSADPFFHTSLGVQGGESDNLDNIELGLNGLIPDGSGDYLANYADTTAVGAAKGMAPALGGPNAPAEFVITNTINLDGTSTPGLPGTDGAASPFHAEVLTYVNLPQGITTFAMNLNGFYRAYVGSWDYLSCKQAGSLNNAVSGLTTFTVLAPVAGVYPVRIAYALFNTSLQPQFSLYTVGAYGTNVLLNDVANGGLRAYYSLPAANKPYVRYASPRPVPRQVEYPNNRVLLRLQDGVTGVNDSTPVFNLDGQVVPVTKNRVGDVLELTWTATTLQTPAEIHTGILTFRDTAGTTYSNQWSFLNLKAVWLPTAVDGYWVPTNAIAVEDFSQYVNAANVSGTNLLTDLTASANWYLSPTNYANTPVDVAPVLTGIPGAGTNWYVWSWNAAGDDNWDFLNANSLTYANFVVIDAQDFASNESSVLRTAPGEMINGVPLVQLIADPTANILVAESDNRSGSTVFGQNQYAISKSFNLSSVANPVIAFAALQKQNQDNINSVEYSVDGGATWAPIIYYLDGHALGSDPADLQVNADTTVNVINTLFHDLNAGEIPTFTDSTGNVNNTFSTAVAAPITDALAPFFAPRVNDDNYDGKRIEVVRLPLAAHKSDVRLRVGQIGTCSWYFGLSQVAFYDVPPSGAIVPTGLPAVVVTPSVLSYSVANGQITVTWTGTGTLQSATVLGNWSNVTPAPVGNSYTAPIGAGNRFFRVVSHN